MSHKSDNCHKSSSKQSLNPSTSKRVADGSDDQCFTAKRLTTDSLDREMENTFGGSSFGRGRGLIKGRAAPQPVATSPQPSTSSPRPDSSNQRAGGSTQRVNSPRTSGRKSPLRGDPEPEDPAELQKKRIKEAEEKSGISIDFLTNHFNFMANGQEVIDKKPIPFAQPLPWCYEGEKKASDPMEMDVDVETKEKKFSGKQYSVEAVEKERRRVLQLQREHMDEEPSTSSPGRQSPAGVRPKPFNKSMQSLMNGSMISSTNIESVGTFRPGLEGMATIDERPDLSEDMMERYFSGSKPKRPSLPISQYEQAIIDAVTINRVVVIEGATGCGKTTQVPQYIADECAAKGLPFNIVVTQPRRIAAKSIAARVAKERNWELGTIVGYQIGMDRTKVTEDTRLLYCTTGVLLQRLINAKELTIYSHIIIDEVHERSIETDLLLLVIKKLMDLRTVSTKIILMSATFDVNILQDYFIIPVDNGDGTITEIRPTHLNIKERPQELNIYYFTQIKKDLDIKESSSRDIREVPSLDERDAPCVTVTAMDTAIAILERGLKKLEDDTVPSKGSVLVFLPGLEEISEMKVRLERSSYRNPQHWKIYPLHSSIPLDRQNEIFYEPRGQERKIILATNIAESSITVPDVSFVIDFCLTKTLVCDIETYIPVLRMEWASKANCQQRAGRAGRVRQGRVFRLVDKQFYDRLADYNQPELVRSPLDLSILRVKMLDMGPPKELLGLALDPPDLCDIYHAVLQLKQVGAFSVKVTERGRVLYDDEDGDITTLGIIMSCLPIDIRLSKLIVMGHVFDVLMDCIIIAACLSTQGMFRKEFSQGLSGYKSRLSWSDRSFSDCMASLNAYKMFKEFGEEFQSNKPLAETWCRQNYIQHKRVLEVDYLVGELMQRLRRENIEVPIRPNLRRNRHEEELILKVVMCAAFYPNYFTRTDLATENIPKMLGNRDARNTVVINGFPQNEGLLYTREIRDMFSICSKRIDFHFEDTKAYLTFRDDRHPLKDAFDAHRPMGMKQESRASSQLSISMKSEDRDTPFSDMSSIAASTSTLTSTQDSSSTQFKKERLKETVIKTAVYVAIAMRTHRECREIPKLIDKVATERMNSLQKFKTEGIPSTFRSNLVSVPHVTPRFQIKRQRLPAIQCSSMDILITHITDPSNFWAQYAHPITSTAINILSQYISYEMTSKPCDSETIRIGDLVIGRFISSDGAKLDGRGRIENLEYKPGTKEVAMAEVFYIDYGITEFCFHIRELSQVNARTHQALLDIPAQAFNCCLSQVNPSAISSFDSCWAKKSIDYFRDFVKKNKILNAKIYSVINKTVRLEVFPEQNRDHSFNDELVVLGLAEKWEESQQSKLNRTQRQRTQISLPVEKLGELILEEHKPGVYNPDDIVEIPFESEKNPNERTVNIRSHDKITIKGPFSPLECSFQGITTQTSNRSVKIDRDSVNCVVLEPDYLSKHSRLLVASSIGLSQNTGTINLRETTLMPNIRGYPALMALLFAPRVQLRANKESTQYVSAMCGIGYNTESMKSYDPDYDAEIVFDSDISLKDMIRINVIRYNITTLLESRDSLREYVEGSLAIKQRKVRRLVIELLDRRRLVKNYSQYYPTHRWQLIPEDMALNPPEKKNELALNRQLLPLCEMPRLGEYDWFVEVEKNLNQLDRLNEGQLSATTNCLLCEFKAYTRQDIVSHTLSPEHMEMVNDFNKDFKINEEEKVKERYYTQELDNNIQTDNPVFDIESDSD